MSTTPEDEPQQAAKKQEEDPEADSSSPFEQQDSEERAATQMTCDVLCSLSASCPSSSKPVPSETLFAEGCSTKKKNCKAYPKQLQLPMFLSKTYHMIDRCDPLIATWSETGDNFVVKNVEKFASTVLPLYFKHSNFSSFARQLNFYGFRKLRTDPILTSDVDPRTACFIRFYHEKFQKDKPELLHQIKRATKTDQQSKDDVESLKQEVALLKETLQITANDFDRKLADLAYESNRRISAMNAEYDKLAALVQRALGAIVPSDTAAAAALVLRDFPPAAAAAAAAPVGPVPAPAVQVPNLLHLSQVAAVSLQNHLRQAAAPAASLTAPAPTSGVKRAAKEDDDGGPPSSRQRFTV